MASSTLRVTRCFISRQLNGRRGLSAAVAANASIPSGCGGAAGASAALQGFPPGARQALSSSARPATNTADGSSDPSPSESDWDEGGGGGGRGAGAVFGGVGGPQSLEAREWNPSVRRSGALAMKVGSMAIFDSWGVRHPVTVLQLDECEVVQVKTTETDGYTSLQLGVGERKTKNVNKPDAERFRRAGVNPKRKLMEFRVSAEALLPVGFQLRAQHFVAGQKVDVCGTSKGKGFQGGMKRWGFKGQRASHGVSKTPRHIGSTGQCQDPGRVFKGKKMPGRMGTDRVTVQNLKILKMDPVRELLFVRGHVPGQNGGFVRVTDAIKGAAFPSDPPFPSFVAVAEGDGDDSSLQEIWCPQGEEDPLEIVDED
ncbi:Ribosomal protein L3 [Ectocarpus siliculosus]|uniref:Large ribosomal subunit protein uL3m n=1 Tax=Ectocarpus siliculosus TaxID=2880 RepID=D8LR42_ECTSI|nr:Ribosomal protein L3 [Ectocarpus siliculosus]|eukprot:CBN77715.1 Ribosomal protein L3 [Ectocarpus siliculosus]